MPSLDSKQWFSEERIQALISRFQGGETGAFEELWLTFAPHIMRLMRSAWRDTPALNAHRAEEVVSTVMTAVFENLNRYKRQAGASFISWLQQIAFTKKLDELKGHTKTQRQKSLDEPDPLTDEPLYSKVADRDSLEPTDELLGREAAKEKARQLDRVQQVLAGLPPADNLLVTLRYFEKMSYEEIAIRLDGDAKAAAKYRKRWERIRDQMLAKMSESSTVVEPIPDINNSDD